MREEDSAAREIEHPSFCRICNAACGLRVTTLGERVLRVRGDPTHPLSRGYTCPKGRALAAFHHDPKRLDHPGIRRDGRLERVTWPEALDDLGRSLSGLIAEAGPGSIAYYLGTAIAFDTCGYWASEAFFDALGTPQKYTCATVDTPAKLLVSELMTGLVGLHPIPDIEQCRMLLLMGTNPVVSHGHLSGFTNPVQNLRRIARQGEVWVVDPRRTATARGATRHLAIRPGGDAFLLAFLVRELLRKGADFDYLASHAEGLDALISAVAPFDLERTLAATGLESQEVLDLLAAIRSRRRLVGLSGTGTTMSAGANLTEWLLWALQIVTGSFERPGGAWFNPGFVSRLDRIETWQHADGRAAPGPASRPELPRRRGEYPCAALVDEIEAGNVRALFVPGGNPIAAFPDSERTLAALRRLEVLVVGDVVQNEIVDLATHVWPCTGQLERADLSGLMEFYRLAVIGQLARPIVPPVAERRPLWWCFDQLAERLGWQIRPPGFEAEQGAEADEALLEILYGKDVDLSALATAKILDEATVGWVERKALRGGRWQLAPPDFVRQLGTLRPAPDRVLIPGRQLRTMNSALRDVAAEGERKAGVRIHLAPEDAEQAGLAEGDGVRVRSAVGELVGKARIDASLRAGSVWIPHGWLDPNVSRLTSSEHDIDPLTGMVLQSGVAVEIERILELSPLGARGSARR
ncbi:MAG: molybdopterin-dependent oxidoreductase [Deltaproteobacteria bacterium]|nr:molybdopterin-dependent oxidoreductase [Deltaproteobacteria bacterium]